MLVSRDCRLRNIRCPRAMGKSDFQSHAGRRTFASSSHRIMHETRATVKRTMKDGFGCFRQINALCLFILMCLALAGVTGVHIKDLRVPRLIQNGTVEYVTLDCDYTLDDADKTGLVVKWFFRDEQTPVYQWIPNQRPKALGILRGKLNLEYQASQDAYKMYRALQIYQPSVNLSGVYLCRVSTFAGEAYKAARMIVFAPEKDMGMRVAETRLPGYVNISCWATGVYPEPRLALYYGDGDNRDQIVEDLAVETSWNQGAYDIRAFTILEEANFSSSVFGCELSIPEAEYVVRRSTMYEPGSFELRGGCYANGHASSTLFQLRFQNTAVSGASSIFLVFFSLMRTR